MSGSGPDGAANLPEFILSRLASFGDQLAQVDYFTGESVTFHEVWEKVHQTGEWLRGQGLGRGCTVGVCLENSLEYTPLVLGILQAGGVAALYPSTATSREFDHLLSLSKPKAVFIPNIKNELKDALCKYTDIKFLNYNLGELECTSSSDHPIELCPARLESTALLLSSSGSTGLPKEVIIKHSNVLWALSSVSHLLMERGKPALGLMPFYHAYGFGLMLMALSQGSPYIIMNKFSIKDFNKAIYQHKIHNLHVVPSLLVKISSDVIPSKTLRSVRSIFTGAGAVSMKIQEKVLNKLEPGAKIFHSYGMTETTHIVSLCEMRSDKSGSSGTIIPCMKAKIIRDDGTTASVGEQGELCLQGPMVTCGYYNNSIATEETFTPDRWLKTGDLAKIDKEGYLYIIDRIKDIIKYQGYTISVTELEQVIHEIKGINEVAVVGVQHEVYGEVPKAFVVRDNKSKISEEYIQEVVSKQLSHYKWLRGGVKFIDSLPKTPNMKINRKLLRNMQ